MAAPPPHPFVYIDAAALHSLLPFPSLIPHLRAGLAHPELSASIQCPQRVSFPLPTAPSTALLLMPSWCAHPLLPYLALKAVTSFPSNAPRLPSVHAAVSLFSSATGAPLASVDGSALTLLRTAAVSALAASLLASPSRPPSVLALAGAGALAPYLAEAHLAALPSISRVLVWNRTRSKSAALVARLRAAHPGLAVEEVEAMDEAVAAADIVSCATGSREPIVRGGLLRPGAHLDLVGSFTTRRCAAAGCSSTSRPPWRRPGSWWARSSAACCAGPTWPGLSRSWPPGPWRGGVATTRSPCSNPSAPPWSISWPRSWPTRQTSPQPRTLELQLFADDGMFADNGLFACLYPKSRRDRVYK
ncbi:delta(1)-pyrroline-2-carboxylate reductase [Panicum miliaceum]|uniref:Delta(1)-pyrroline-2-carboxylate reductase n=1 Tax=Panicum miliaceum TaxID=4540 RepID=A0A3L6SIW9_PANMI|nr:delta(1)-pyrroline-2-carboxylate reductase [Panicum miliaceum]